MRTYIIGNDGIALCRKAPATVSEGEIVVTSKEELHAAALNGKRLLALWNALPGVDKKRKLGNRAALIDQLWSAIEALPDPEPRADPKRPSRAEERRQQALPREQRESDKKQEEQEQLQRRRRLLRRPANKIFLIAAGMVVPLVIVIFGVWFAVLPQLASEARRQGYNAFELKNYAEAMRWYRKAADQGNDFAQTSIGELYDRGWGVAQDYAEAARWYRKAADQGYAAAQANIRKLKSQ